MVVNHAHEEGDGLASRPAAKLRPIYSGSGKRLIALAHAWRVDGAFVLVAYDPRRKSTEILTFSRNDDDPVREVVGKGNT